MKINHLSDKQLEKIWATDPVWVMDNCTMWAWMNYRIQMIEHDPAWCCRYSPRYMAENYIDLMYKYRPEWYGLRKYVPSEILDLIK